MALRDALLRCLCVLWLGHPGLGLPLAPSPGPSPAPAVGESSGTLSLPPPPTPDGAARERWGGSAAPKSEAKCRALAGCPGRAPGEPSAGRARAAAAQGPERPAHPPGGRAPRGEVPAPQGRVAAGARSRRGFARGACRRFAPGEGRRSCVPPGKRRAVGCPARPADLNPPRAGRGAGRGGEGSRTRRRVCVSGPATAFGDSFFPLPRAEDDHSSGVPPPVV